MIRQNQQAALTILQNSVNQDPLHVIENFRKAFGMALRSQPVVLSRDRMLHHHRLFMEELGKEFMEAVDARDIVGITDSLMDGLVVLLHAIHEFGLAPNCERLFGIVDESNLSKLEDGRPIYDAKGKFLKGKNYHPPDLSNELCRILCCTRAGLDNKVGAVELPFSTDEQTGEPTYSGRAPDQMYMITTPDSVSIAFSGWVTGFDAEGVETLLNEGRLFTCYDQFRRHDPIIAYEDLTDEARSVTILCGKPTQDFLNRIINARIP